LKNSSSIKTLQGVVKVKDAKVGLTSEGETATAVVGAQTGSIRTEVTNPSFRATVIVDPTVAAEDIRSEIVSLSVGTAVDVD